METKEKITEKENIAMGETNFLDEIASAANARSTYQDLLDFTENRIVGWIEKIYNDIKEDIRGKVEKGEFSTNGEKKVVTGSIDGSMKVYVPSEIENKLNSDEKNRFNARHIEIFMNNNYYNEIQFRLKALSIIKKIENLVDKSFLFFHWAKKEDKTILNPYIDGISKRVLLELRDKASKDGIQLTISCSYEDSKCNINVGAIMLDAFTELTEKGLKNHPPVIYQNWRTKVGIMQESVEVVLCDLAKDREYWEDKKYFDVQVGYAMEF